MNMTIPLARAARRFRPTVNISTNLFFPETLAFSISSKACMSVQCNTCQCENEKAREARI